jgi:YbbR domain-containing protein
MTSPSRLSILTYRNLKWFILCSFLGICLFLLWPGSSVQETDIFIPVDYSQIPEGLTIATPPLNGIEVRIRGPESAIKALSDQKLGYVLDLSGVDVGVKSIAINQDQILLSKGISIIKTNPAFLTVKVEKEIKTELPVKVILSGKPATGYLVANTVAKPLSVILRGPENVIDPMEGVLTKPIDIKGLSESFKKEIALDLPKDIEIIAPSNIIIAEIFIEEKIISKKFHDILIGGKDTSYVYSISPKAIDIEVKGPVNIIDKLNNEKGINVYVDLKGLTPGVYIRRATITLPVKTILVGVKPEIFTVKVTRTKKKN